jgi:hypothetical protein
MRRFGLLALLSIFLALPLTAQNPSTSGSFTLTIAGFSPVGTCQPTPTGAACPLPTPTIGTPYTATLPTVGLPTPITCTVSSGALPAWATLTSSGANCVITGTPSGTGTATFNLTATGS